MNIVVGLGDPSDGPFLEIAAEMDRAICEGDATVFGKWTCRGCWTRQIFDTPNVLFTTGRCEECDYITDLVAWGCGFLLVKGEQHEKIAAGMVADMQLPKEERM